MNSNFEKDVMQALDGFSINPSQEVWKTIEQNLPKKRKKRAIFWWLTAAVFVIATVVVFDYNATKNKAAEKLMVNQNKESKNVVLEKEVKQKGIAYEREKNRIGQKQTSVLFEDGVLKKSNTKTTKKIQTKTKIEANSYIKRLIENNKRNILIEKKKQQVENKDWLPIIEVAKQQKPKANEVSNSSVAKKATNDNIKIEEQEIKKPIPLKDANVIIDSSILGKMVSLDLSNKKWKIGLAFGGGVQKVTTSTFFGNNQEEKSNISNLLGGGGFGAGGLIPPTTGAITIPYRVLSLPSAGMHFNIGATAAQKLSKRFSLQTGLFYQFSQNKSLVNLDSVGSSINFYVEGNTINYSNQSHRINIPFQLQTNIYQAPKLSIYVITGFETTFMLSNNYLTQSKNENVYFQSTESYTKWLWSVQAGFGANFNNKFSAQIVLNKGLTPIANNGVKNYFSSIDAMMIVPIKSLKKSK